MTLYTMIELVKLWPIIFPFLGVIVWAIRLEGKSKSSQEKFMLELKLRDQLIEQNTMVCDHLTRAGEHFKGILDELAKASTRQETNTEFLMKQIEILRQTIELLTKKIDDKK